MTERHAGWPVRDQHIPAAYTGKHRVLPSALGAQAEPDDPPRCWSCGHPFDALCECLCCHDEDDHSGGPDYV